MIMDTQQKTYSTMQTSQLKGARVGAIVACRMKSSRLKHKAILPINGRASVARCLDNCLQIEGADVVVLATSTLDEDNILESYTLDGNVKFWRGDPEDVIQRYLGACQEFGIDVIVRATADCPVVSPEIAKILLEHHVRTGADYTAAREVAVGTGCEIYSTEALRRVIKYLGKAEYSEYMTWYLRNNQDLFKVEFVDLPSEMVRDYRLTLDYSEDLEMFNRLYAELEKKKLAPSLLNIFSILGENPSISSINSNMTLQYKSDADLINTLNRVTKINVAI
jgi:N,N'-diacetyllegionaminate synthase